MESNYYIYCITDGETNIPAELRGFGECNAYMIPFRDIQALVSPVTVTHYDSCLQNLKVHEETIHIIMKNDSVLPMKFSTIVKSEEDVIRVLRNYYSQFIENLVKVKDKVELGIKIFFKIENSPPQKSGKNMSGKEYFLGKYEQYLNLKAMLSPYLNTVEKIHEKLDGISDESYFTVPLKNNLIMNASYLVRREKYDDFKEETEKFKSQYKYFKIVFSGPWPPYHFVKVKEEGVSDE